MTSTETETNALDVLKHAIAIAKERNVTSVKDLREILIETYENEALVDEALRFWTDYEKAKVRAGILPG